MQNLAIFILFLFFTACTRDPVGTTEGDGRFIADSPETAVRLFQTVYNFRANGIDVEQAIELYADLFVENDSGYHYRFDYWPTLDGMVSNQDSLDYTEEMNLTSRMFRTVESNGLYLDLKTFSIVSSAVEAADDTSLSGYRHPGESRSVLRIYTYMIMDDPTGGKPFLVEGDVDFVIRQCSDGHYRIVRWTDLTYEKVLATKAASGYIIPMMRHSWASIKLLYK